MKFDVIQSVQDEHLGKQDEYADNGKPCQIDVKDQISYSEQGTSNNWQKQENR